MGKTLASFLIALAIMFLSPLGVLAQELDINPEVTYQFGDHVDFQITVFSENPIELCIVFIREENTHNAEAELMQVVKGSGEQEYQLNYTLQISEHRLSPFSWVEYWFEFQFAGGEKYQSGTYRFFYRDNRINWQVLEQPPFQVYWHDEDINLAQDALDSAQEGLQKINQIIPYDFQDEVQIYLYLDAREMQEALGEMSLGWLAGHASPDSRVMLVALPGGPERQLTLKQRIPHELMHIVLSIYGQGSYNRLPVWLSEGLASLVESYTNPDYQTILEYASEEDSFLPMVSLCDSFPTSASSALLAYAQAESFTRFLSQYYGQSKLRELVDVYLDGLSCERGVEIVYGKSLFTLERRWRKFILQDDVLLEGIQNLTPWFVLLVGVLIVPLGISLSRIWVKTKGNPQT